jgi:mannitol-1-phosphate/altronate dehydrogenase
VPKFVLPSALELNERGDRNIYTALVVAGYLRYLQGEGENGDSLPLIDPLAEQLRTLARNARTDPRPLLEGCPEVFGTDLPRAMPFVEQLATVLRELYANGVKATLKRYVDAG